MKEYDAVDKMLDALIEDAAILAAEELANELPEPEPVEFSKEHIRKMKAIFQKPQRKLKMAKIARYSRRAAVVLLVMILVSGATIFSVEAWRVQFLNFVISVTQTNTDIVLTGENRGTSYRDDLIELNYIPSDFELTGDRKHAERIWLEFESSENYFGLAVRSGGGALSIDTENAFMQKMTINGCEAYLSVNENVTILVWHDTVYSYTLDGNIEENEIIRIAKNVQRIE